jgi:hypothetical protein
MTSLELSPTTLSVLRIIQKTNPKVLTLEEKNILNLENGLAEDFSAKPKKAPTGKGDATNE